MKMPKMNPMAYMRQMFDKVRVQLMSVYGKLDAMRIGATDPSGLVTVTLNGRARVEAVAIDADRLAGLAPADAATALAAAFTLAAQAAYVESEETRKRMSAEATGGMIPKGIDLPLEAI